MREDIKLNKCVLLFLNSSIKDLLTSSLFELGLLLSGATARTANIELKAALINSVIST